MGKISISALFKAKHFGGRRDRHKRRKRLFFAKKKHGGMPF